MASKRSNSTAATRPILHPLTSDQVEASTSSQLLENPPIPSTQNPQAEVPSTSGSDAFETRDDSDSNADNEANRASIELDELPIELVTLIDSFIGSLSAKVHSTPPNVDKLSQLFQNFYVSASANIATHVGALASRSSRDASPAPSSSSRSSATSRLRTGTSSPLIRKDSTTSDHVGQQMITSEELAEKKRAKRAWEAKRALLEEAVERRLCEGIYDRIYRHRSTQDEAQDVQLRSKTAALSLLGISPSDLGVDLGQDFATVTTTDLKERLAPARADFTRMHESRYPRGKLNHLKAAHRSVVDTLAHFQPSASADEIMPMLIYTLITMAPQSIHVISDLCFMQRFRWEPKLTGEAAYCLTNLEAVISFLQTVDLSTLRADEQPSGPAKAHSNPQLQRAETFPPAYDGGLSATDTANTPPNATAAANETVLLKPAIPVRTRRLSDLVNTPAQALGAASDVVFSTADQSLKTISNSLGDSYKFLLGKVRERQQGPKDPIAVPRTLDDARKLVSTPPPLDYNELDVPSGASSSISAEDADERDGTRPLAQRQRSTDGSIRPRTSKRSYFPDGQPHGPTSSTQSNQNPAVLEQMRQLVGNQLNPMARLSSISGFRGFGRGPSTSSAASTPNASTPPATHSSTKAPPGADGGDLGKAFPDIAAALPPKQIPKIPPPNKRFMELQSPGDLKLGEVLDLLKDYRRLAKALNSMGAFDSSSSPSK